VIAIAAATALSGCATADSPPANSDQVVLTANVWSDWTFVQSAGEEFKKTHPNVTVKLNAIPDGTYWSKIPDLFKTDDTPDISSVPVDMDWFPAFASAGLLAPLDSAWADSGLNDNAIEGLKERYTHGDHQYAVSVGGVVVPLIYYNKELFAQAGITEVKQTGMTMEEFYAISDQLKASGIDPLTAGIGDGTLPFRVFAPVFTSICGAEWETKAADGDTAVWKEPCVEKGLEVVADWQQRGIFAGGAAVGTASSSVAQATFSSGKAAMLMQGTWATGALRDADPDMGLGWFQMPIAADGPQTMSLSSIDALAVSSGSKHVEEATEFLAFLANYAGVWEHGIPPRGDLPAPAGTDELLVEVADAIGKDGASVALEQVTPANVVTTIQNAIVAVVVGQQTPAQAAESISAGA
jgi:ABC-type glycerol-3-phosphate transport system substrate-binding protein